MYDLITGKFLTNAGTGNFIAGPTMGTSIDRLIYTAIKQPKYYLAMSTGLTSGTFPAGGNMKYEVQANDSSQVKVKWGRSASDSVEGSVSLIVYDSETGKSATIPANTPITLSYNLSGNLINGIIKRINQNLSFLVKIVRLLIPLC